METNRLDIRVLLVDDESRVLTALKRSFSKLSPDLHFELASGGCEAIKLSDKKNFDVVISDLRMPNADGETVLKHIRRSQPDSIRIVLSGQASVDKLLDTLCVSHQYLEKPCPSKRLSSVIGTLSVVSKSRLPKILIKLLLTMTSMPCDGALTAILRQQIEVENFKDNLDMTLTSDLGILIGLLRLQSIIKGGVIAPDEKLDAESIPENLLIRLLGSHLLIPLFEQNDLLRAVRIISIKSSILGKRLSKIGFENYKMLAIIAYLGELALINCVGADPNNLSQLINLRDQITEVLWSLWGLPEELLTNMGDNNFISYRKNVDGLFPIEDLKFITDQEVLEMFGEIVCSID